MTTDNSTLWELVEKWRSEMDDASPQRHPRYHISKCAAELAAILERHVVVGEWLPIESAPKGKKGYSWMRLAWGPDDDKHTADGFRWGDRFFACPTFYRLGQEKQYEMREMEVQPTHWMPNPPWEQDEYSDESMVSGKS